MGSGLVGIESKPTGNTFRPPPGFMDGDPSQLAGGTPSGDPMVSSTAMHCISKRLIETHCGLLCGCTHCRPFLDHYELSLRHYFSVMVPQHSPMWRSAG